MGFSFGFDRLIEVMENQDLFPKDLGGARILVTNTSNRSAQIANELRNRNIDVELYVDEKEVDKQLRYADKKGIPYILLFEGDNLVLKNMKTGKQKQFDNVEELIDELTTW